MTSIIHSTQNVEKTVFNEKNLISRMLGTNWIYSKFRKPVSFKHKPLNVSIISADTDHFFL